MTINPINLDNRNYWYIRTDKGLNFQTFYENNFVAIGWNEITIDDLIRHDENHQPLRNRVESANQESLNDLTLTGKKSQITLIIKKNLVFHSMKKGDIVIIPSANTEYLAFGIVDDERTYSETGHNCSYFKRRKIKWLRTENASRLDAKFAYVTKSFHAISEIDSTFHDIINNYMFDSYMIDNASVISIKLNTNDPIQYNSMKSIIDGIISIGKQYAEKEGLDETIEDVEIQINLQSPGFISLKGAGVGLVFALTLLSYGCSKDVSKKEEYKRIVEQYDLDISESDSIVNSLDEAIVKF